MELRCAQGRSILGRIRILNDYKNEIYRLVCQDGEKVAFNKREIEELVTEIKALRANWCKIAAYAGGCTPA